MKVIKIIFKIIVYGFAVIGFVLMAGFFAVKYDLTNTVAVVDRNNDKYQAASMKFDKSDSYNAQANTLSGQPVNLSLSDLDAKIAELKNASQTLADLQLQKWRNLCQIEVIGEVVPVNGQNIVAAYRNGVSAWTFNQMVLAVSLRLDDNQIFQKKLSDCQSLTSANYIEGAVLQKYSQGTGENLFAWANLESWEVVTKAILKDEAVIKKAASTLELNPRLLVSILIVEQLRLYNTQREFYERFFKPLEILANANKMAWGVMAIKEKTAIDIEIHSQNSKSAFYPGEGYSHLLDFNTDNEAKERYDRLANEHDHYYSYLYGGLLLKELIAQWEISGYNVANRPEVLATLFNIGFTRSKPKDNPQVGGSVINLNGVDYTFGSLAHEFYYSNLIPEFPLK